VSGATTRDQRHKCDHPCPLPDASEIRRALDVLHPDPSDVIELRAIGVSEPRDRRPHTVSGYFLDRGALVETAARVSACAVGTYVTLNVINRALLARAVNRARAVGEREPTTSDHDVVRRLWLPIDVDPIRPAGISSSDDERERARTCAQAIREHLAAEGWSAPVIGDSGNGYHLLYRTDMPTEGVHALLGELKRHFSDEHVKVDEANYNLARIWKLYGTPARKGDHAPIVGRPHRLSRLIKVPA
jgi:hypothetical protein